VREEARSLKLLIHERLLPFHAFYLGLFDFREIVLIKDDELVQAESVVFPSHVTPELVPHGQVIAEMSAYVFRKLNISAAQPLRNVFISREKARYRHAINEPEVWAVFRNYGFEKVWMEELLVEDQVRLLAQTRKLSGIHGAGFSNMLYMQRGEVFMDLMHKDYRSNGFYNLASVFNINFVLLQCEGTGRSKDPRTDNLRVNMAILEKYLDAYFT
jgi:capsular polysaccharide biosynthesis protein